MQRPASSWCAQVGPLEVRQPASPGKIARVGIFFLMVTFGASFGYTVMSRMSLLIGRMDFLFGDWLGLVR